MMGIIKVKPTGIYNNQIACQIDYGNFKEVNFIEYKDLEKYVKQAIERGEKFDVSELEKVAGEFSKLVSLFKNKAKVNNKNKKSK